MSGDQLRWSIVCLLVLTGYFVLHRNTLLGINISQRNFGGVLFLETIGMFVLPGVVVISTVDVSSIPQLLHTRLPDAIVTSWWIIYALVLFTLVTWVFVRVFPGTFRLSHIQSTFPTVAEEALWTERVKLLLIGQVISGVLVFAAGAVLFGLRHAVLESLVRGENLLAARLAIRNAAGVPGPVLSYMSFLSYFIAVVLGMRQLDNALGLRFLGTVALVFFSTVLGDKALPLNALILSVLSYATYHRLQLNLKSILVICLILAVIGGGLNALLVLQFGSVTYEWFKEYAYVRLVLGQIAGTYEQFALKLRDNAYWWHAVPFASLFVDYPIHARDLMLASENVWDPSKTGVKNSLFISEAHAMGGIPLVILSPLIVASSYMMGFAAFRWLALRMFRIEQIDQALFLLYARIFNLTGDFTTFVFMKGLVLCSIFLIAVSTVFWGIGVFRKLCDHWLVRHGESSSAG